MAGHELKRVLGKGFSMAACAGLIIGLGILRTPGEIATSVQDPLVYMALWVGGGVMVLLSLAVAAELIALTPRSGGIYALIAHAYGRYPGFLIGWTDWVANAASGALKAVVVVEYLALLNPAISTYTMEGALLVTTCFALLQLGGVRLGGGVLQAGAAIVGFLMLCLAGSLFYGGLTIDVPAPLRSAAVPGGITSWGLVAAAVVFTYDGWLGASYFGGEIRGGGRMAAIGSIRGLLVVIAIYLGLNAALVFSVPLASLQGHDLALAGALELVFGPGAGLWIILTAILILLAHQNIQYMVGTRILYALSVDGMGASSATAISNGGTPVGALLFSWLLTCVLIMAGGWAFLLSMATLLWMIMYVAIIVGVFRLRATEPAANRPYRAWGFPASGVVCALFWVAVSLFVAITDPRSSLYSLALVAISAPAYLWLKRKRHLEPQIKVSD
ncbi:MAG: APC family permease [Xanthomonadales bacterium]|nr:APC family permease [Xanthomonadales bacterium]